MALESGRSSGSTADRGLAGGRAIVTAFEAARFKEVCDMVAALTICVVEASSRVGRPPSLEKEGGRS